MKFFKQNLLWLTGLLCLVNVHLIFAQVTITTGANWQDATLIRSLNPREVTMASTNYNTYPHYPK